MPLGNSATLFLGLLFAAWTLAAGIAILNAQVRLRRGDAGRLAAKRLARMVDESPAIPMLVRADGRIEAPQRLAQWLGFDKVPQFLSELAGADRGVPADQLHELTEAVRRTQKTAAPFRMVLTPLGSRRSLALRGHLADPQVSPGGAALVWVFDFSDSESELMQLRREAARANKDFAALVALIEAAPLPMWFRTPDGRLRLVNSAYVAAVGGGSAEEVAAAGIELVETVEGKSAVEVALQAAASGQPVEREVMVTIAGERRAFRVNDLPLRDEGIAGYAIDVEELEALTRSFDAFRRAQRSMLDHLSAGVAQFSRDRRLIFANRPFHSMFALDHSDLWSRPSLDHLLGQAHDAGRVPEARDFPQWRIERSRWFEAADAVEEAWPLSDGTHLRVVAQPVPDGGLLLIVEDRTEHLRLSASRDTMMRTQAATFDSLFESVAAFAPNGRMQLWNRRFASDWRLESEFLDTHPHIEALLRAIARQLEDPTRVSALGDAVRMATLDRVGVGGRLAMADGRSLEFAGVPLPDGNGLLTVRDVTDTATAEEALRGLTATVREADAMRERALADVSQGIRTPLIDIAGAVARLRAATGAALDEPARSSLGAILGSVERIDRQVDRLSDVGREAPADEPEPAAPERRAVFELLPFAVALVEARRERIEGAGLDLDLRGDRFSRKIEGDEARLASAIGALLDRAIATTPRGGRILFEVSRKRVKGRERARIIVSDNGAGMDEAELAWANGSAGAGDAGGGEAGDLKVDVAGYAPGVPLAREVIEAHGGVLELMSEPGQGTAAIVELP